MVTQNQSSFRILCLDGGGGKGIYTLGVLREVEKSLGRPLNEHFNLFYGTSTGAIIATALAKGAKVAEILDFYFEKLPKIMTTFWACRRSSHLEACLVEFFGDSDFHTLGNVGLGIVATHQQDKKPLIFKNLPTLAHGLKHSFEPGFGLSLAEAVEASCSAVPFFKPKSLALKNASQVNAIDGGFVANNPALYALIDARKALGIADSDIRLLSVGTGQYPEKYPIYSYINGALFLPALKMISMQFTANSNSVDTVFKLLASNVPYVRINQTFSEPQLTTSLFEHRKPVLERLLGKGRDSFASHEIEILKLLK